MLKESEPIETPSSFFPQQTLLPAEYIVLDMEWNQAPIWEQRRAKPLPLTGEIIEIGAVRISPEGEVKDRFKSLVKPKYFKRMNARVAEITGITADLLEDAPSFPDAFGRFLDFCGKREGLAILTWGPDDIPMLLSNLQVYGMDPSHLPPAYDLQVIFNRQITGETRQWALGDAVQLLELPKQWTAHDALHDALYTALVAGKLKLSEGVASYGEGDTVLEKRSVVGLKTWKSVFEAREMAEFCCPGCKTRGKLSLENWIFKNSGQRIAAYRCSCGKDYFLRCKFQKAANGLYSGRRTVHPMNEKYAEQIETAKEKEKNRHSKKTPV